MLFFSDPTDSAKAVCIALVVKKEILSDNTTILYVQHCRGK